MRCPFCDSEQSSVVDKRAVKTSGEIRRRRECLNCHKRYTTYEKVSVGELYVVKRDGRRELFDKGKLRVGLEKALEKRPALGELDNLVRKIENKCRSIGKREVNSKVIGRMALTELKKLDQVAYLRFVSVYRQFKEADDFTKELKSLTL